VALCAPGKLHAEGNCCLVTSSQTGLQAQPIQARLKMLAPGRTAVHRDSRSVLGAGRSASVNGVGVHRSDGEKAVAAVLGMQDAGFQRSRVGVSTNVGDRVTRDGCTVPRRAEVQQPVISKSGCWSFYSRGSHGRSTERHRPVAGSGGLKGWPPESDVGHLPVLGCLPSPHGTFPTGKRGCLPRYLGVRKKNCKGRQRRRWRVRSCQ
jgi:hypothetical protein